MLSRYAAAVLLAAAAANAAATAAHNRKRTVQALTHPPTRERVPQYTNHKAIVGITELQCLNLHAL